MFKTKVRNTSVEAYRSLNNLGERQRGVFGAIKDLKIACNSEIAVYLDMPINQITPRTNELVEAGLVEEGLRDKSPHTGKRVIFWQLSSEGMKMFNMKTSQPNLF